MVREVDRDGTGAACDLLMTNAKGSVFTPGTPGENRNADNELLLPSLPLEVTQRQQVGLNGACTYT